MRPKALARARIRTALPLLEEALEALRPDVDPPADDPPDRDPPPDDGGDDPPDREPPVYSGTPVHRVPVVTPREVYMEWSPGSVRRLSDGTVWTGAGALADAWQASKPRRGALVIGIKGDVGALSLGGQWADHAGFPANVIFVGLTPDAQLGPIQHGSEWPVDRFELHRCGLKANPDSFAWRQGAELGDVAFHDWWIVPMKPGFSHTSGLHFHRGWRSFSCSKYQPRDTRFAEHTLYIKGGGRTQILDCDMKGGGRSFLHYRPHQEGWVPYHFAGTPPPTGSILVEGNTSDGFGYDHASIGGGAVISIWCSLENAVVIKDNAITNCRTGGIMLGRGAKNTNPYTTRDGYSHGGPVWLEDNQIHCTGSQGADPRYAVSLSDIREVAFQGSNRFRSDHRYDLVLDASFSAGQGAKPIGQASFLGRDSVPDVQEAAHWVPSLNAYREFTHQELLDMVEPEPTT